MADSSIYIKRIALISVFASIIILGLKFSAYWYTGSVSMLSDALESFVNIASACLAYVVVTISMMPADENHPYGHDKAEYFAAGVEGILIALSSITIFAYAIEKLIHGYNLSSLNEGIFIAILASFLNAGVAWLLLRAARKGNSIALEANAKHIIADIWTTVVVVLGLIIIRFVPELSWIDPVLAICLAIFILYTGARLIIKSVNGLMDVALPDKDIKVIYNILSSNIPTDCEVNTLRTKYQGKRRFIDFILLVDGAMTVKDSHDICDDIERQIDKTFPGSIVIIHVEPKP